MTTKNLLSIQEEIKASNLVKESLSNDKVQISKILLLAENCISCLKSGGKIIFCGNGGSFADAQHLSAEFTSRFLFDRSPLASIVLGANSSAISAIGNDYGFDQVFSRELKAIASEKDILIAISTSGNSENVLSAINTAIELKIKSFILTGRDGGMLKSKIDNELINSINVPSNDTARIQECHILIGHIICGIAESNIFKG